jgi:hypothetical protein
MSGTLSTGGQGSDRGACITRDTKQHDQRANGYGFPLPMGERSPNVWVPFGPTSARCAHRPRGLGQRPRLSLSLELVAMMRALGTRGRVMRRLPRPARRIRTIAHGKRPRASGGSARAVRVTRIVPVVHSQPIPCAIRKRAPVWSVLGTTIVLPIRMGTNIAALTTDVAFSVEATTIATLRSWRIANGTVSAAGASTTASAPPWGFAMRSAVDAVSA